MKKPISYCNTIDELLAMTRMPLSAYPTIASAMREIQLPLNEDDYNWISGNKVQVFQLNDRPRSMSYSNLTPPTFSPDDPIIVTGVCVMLYPEPTSCLIEGNSFGPRNIITETPASPINLRGGAFLNALFAGGQAPAGLEACAAQLEHGGPTWRFVWAMMQAFRLQFNCPNSSYETLVNERLVDIGNACARVEFDGLSDAKTGHIYLTRKYNNRSFDAPDSPNTSDGAGNVPNPGYFVPINSEQTADGEIVPNRMTAVEVAYGQPNGLPAIETWYRLPFPMPMDQNTKISMYMEPSAGDEVYQQRMIDEGVLRQCASPIPGIAGTFPLREGQAVNIGNASFTHIPHGMIRVGLGLKGFQVREGVCHQWKRAIADKSLIADLLNNGTEHYTRMGGAAVGVCGPSGDLGSKVIDSFMAGQDAGPVGEDE